MVPVRLRRQVRGDRRAVLVELILRCNDRCNWKRHATKFALTDLCRDLEWENDKTPPNEQLAARKRLRRILESLHTDGLIDAKTGVGAKAEWRVRLTGALVREDGGGPSELDLAPSLTPSPEAFGLGLTSEERDMVAGSKGREHAPGAGSREPGTGHDRAEGDTKGTKGPFANGTGEPIDPTATAQRERDPAVAEPDTSCEEERDANGTGAGGTDDDRILDLIRERREQREAQAAQQQLDGMPRRAKPGSAP